MYLGQLKTAISLVLLIIGAIAILSWTRLILEPWTVYLLALLVLVCGYLSPFHMAWVAFQKKRTADRPYNRWWAYVIYIIFVIGSLLVLTNVRASIFGYEPFVIPAASMAPTIVAGDTIMVDTWAYEKVAPKNGDVVVLSLNDGSGIKYLKRVAAGPNDSIKIENAVLIVNGEQVTEDYLHQPRDSKPYGRDIAEIQLGDNELFVLGDYRDNSKDSRMFGPITIDQIHGRAIYIWFSRSKEEGIQWGRFPQYLQ